MKSGLFSGREKRKDRHRIVNTMEMWADNPRKRRKPENQKKTIFPLVYQILSTTWLILYFSHFVKKNKSLLSTMLAYSSVHITQSGQPPPKAQGTFATDCASASSHEITLRRGSCISYGLIYVGWNTILQIFFSFGKCRLSLSINLYRMRIT